MSDKPLVQQRLATDLSEIILQITPQEQGVNEDGEEEQEMARDMAALDFIQGFWETIIREWVGIDRFRYVHSLTSPTHAEHPLTTSKPHDDDLEWTNTTCSFDAGSTPRSGC
jgi:hypothetical protein